MIGNDGAETVLKSGLKLEAGEVILILILIIILIYLHIVIITLVFCITTSWQVIDATRMSIAALNDFFEAELQDCKAKGLMVSLHLKVPSLS